MLVVLCAALVVAAVRDNLCLLGKAGLHDRSAIYSKLAALTNSTRSVLYIPSRPCDAFDYTTHGLGGKKDCTRPWSSYFKFPDNVKPYVVGVSCTRLSNAEAYRLQNPIQGNAKVQWVCSEQKSRRTPRPFLYYQIRRSDLLRPHYAKFNNSKLTSVPTVLERFQADHQKYPDAALVWSTDEMSNVWLDAFQRKFAALYPNVTLQRADTLFPGCHTDNYCVFCNVVLLSRKAVLRHKFGRH